MHAVKKLLDIGATDDERLPALELLRRAPLDKLDEVVRALKQRRSEAEVRQAMIDLIATAPLAHFATLKVVFMTHCAEPWH
jgi:hypothetical protein